MAGKWQEFRLQRQKWPLLFDAGVWDVFVLSLTSDKVGSSKNCFRLRLFPLTWRGDRKFIWGNFSFLFPCLKMNVAKSIISITDTLKKYTDWKVCVLWPEGVCRSCGGHHTHCLLIAEIQKHTEEREEWQQHMRVNTVGCCCCERVRSFLYE